MLLIQPSERSLLTCLLAKLQSLDADVLVGHNIGEREREREGVRREGGLII